MNWGRGLFRAWLLVTVLWFALIAAIIRPDQLASTYWEKYQTLADQAEPVSAPDHEAGPSIHTFLFTGPNGKKYRAAGETLLATIPEAEDAPEGGDEKN